MKFAVVEGERREAQPGGLANCLGCGHAMIAKCGQYRVWHWAHRGTRTCDPWWESETEWHRGWKNHFPEDWQEIIRRADDGEKHIADVKTESGLVLEFQHSFLHQDERKSRETFCQKMVWVVDGRRRVRDRARFFASLRSAAVVKLKPLTFSFPSNEGALLRDWGDSRVPVFFDFGDVTGPDDKLRFSEHVLWRLTPGILNGRVRLSPVKKSRFLDTYLNGLPLKAIGRMVDAKPGLTTTSPRIPLIGFEKYLARRQRAWTRARF